MINGRRTHGQVLQDRWKDSGKWGLGFGFRVSAWLGFLLRVGLLFEGYGLRFVWDQGFGVGVLVFGFRFFGLGLGFWVRVFI